jgi:RecB family exonuclease
VPFDDRPTAPQVTGTAIHGALEVFFRCAPESRSPEILHQLFDRAWARQAARRGDSETPNAEIVGRARTLLDRFATSFDLAAVPIRVEQAFELRLHNRTSIRTRIDRIDAWRSGVRIVDYKTGRNQVESADLPMETAIIVHLLAAEHAGYRVERLSWLYLASGEEVYWEPEREDVSLAAERLLNMLRELRDDREFRPAPGPSCFGCPFRARCDAALT